MSNRNYGLGPAAGEYSAEDDNQLQPEDTLIDRGVDHLHFYTMNRADLVFAICHLIGLRAKPAAGAEAPAQPRSA